MQFLRASTFLLLLHGVRPGWAECYYTDGTVAGGDIAPCNPSAANSTCCSIKKSNPDLCLSSGFCMAQESGFEGLIFANGCTDESGNAKECPQACRDKSKGGKTPQIWNLQICSNGQYCCRDAETRKSCCDDEDNLFDFNIGKFQAQATSTTTVFLEATGSGTQTVVPVTVTASSAATCDEGAQEQAGPVSSCSGPSALVVGSAVGGTMGVALLAAVAAIVFLCRRKPATALSKPAPTSHKTLSRFSIHELSAEQHTLQEKWSD